MNNTNETVTHEIRIRAHVVRNLRLTVERLRAAVADGEFVADVSAEPNWAGDTTLVITMSGLGFDEDAIAYELADHIMSACALVDGDVYRSEVVVDNGHDVRVAARPAKLEAETAAARDWARKAQR